MVFYLIYNSLYNLQIHIFCTGQAMNNSVMPPTCFEQSKTSWLIQKLKSIILFLNSQVPWPFFFFLYIQEKLKSNLHLIHWHSYIDLCVQTLVVIKYDFSLFSIDLINFIIYLPLFFGRKLHVVLLMFTLSRCSQ